VWIDTDAACGQGRRTDPDDCLAILLLALTPDVEIAGISTVFGNAPLDVTDSLTRALAAVLEATGHEVPPVHRGAAGPLRRDGFTSPAPAHRALRRALEEGPLTLVALGPLTNVAAALTERPDLQARVGRLVAVMGRRPGHLFHPAEGGGGGMLFGHGPVFRDFNLAMDSEAAARVVAMHLPTTLTPYEAARDIEITGADLDRLTAPGGARAWVAARARPWLGYWRDDVGRGGFYPFDLVAAAYVVEPALFACAQVHAWVGEDPTLFIPFWRPTALLVGQGQTRIEEVRAVGSALFCPDVDAALKARLRRWLGADAAAGPARRTRVGAGSAAAARR
jgi:inosine-uridine nucleoside N-ribohydrolase